MNAFGSCGAVVIEEFAHTAKEMHFQKGQKIIKEGDSADSIYFIARGECSKLLVCLSGTSLPYPLFSDFNA